VVARYTQTEKLDEPLAMLRGGTTSYYDADGLGSITSLSNGAGALAQTYVYDSYGKQISSTGSLTNPFQYAAREFDEVLKTDPSDELAKRSKLPYMRIDPLKVDVGRVADVMSRDYPTVDGHSNLQTFVEEHLVRTGRRCFVVTFNGRPEGILTPNEVSKVERARWPYTTVDDVMRPLDQVRTVTPDTPVTEALEVMAREDLNQLPVVGDGGLAGFVSRAHVLQLLQTRAELHV